LIDYGLASFISEPEFLYKRCGTPGFVAPEIIKLKNKQRYDEKCDIYSIGVIFYILLIGKQPFKSSNYKKVLKLNRNNDIDFNIKEFSGYSW
jgi:serine/threonine protein kinase